MRKLGVLMVVVLLFLYVSVPANANIIDAINNLKEQGLESNNEVNQSYIDLSGISSGSVVARTYTGIEQLLSVNNYSVQAQTYMEAHDRITRFIFELTNRYRPDTDLALSGTGALPTVHAWTYGIRKDDAVWAVVYGLQDCLNNPPFKPSDGGGGGSWIEPYSPANISQTIIERTSTFTINSTTYTINDAVKTMDVAPEIKGDRTFVPVRYLAYSLGVPEEGITWDSKKQEVIITKDNTKIGLTIGSNIQTVNNEQLEMDVAPYIKNGRTMLPARWIAEPLGAKVEWDESKQQVVVTIEQSQGN